MKVGDLIPGETYYPKQCRKLVEPNPYHLHGQGRHEDIWTFEQVHFPVCDHVYVRLMYMGRSRELGKLTHSFLKDGKLIHFSAGSIRCLSTYPEFTKFRDHRRKQYGYV